MVRKLEDTTQLLDKVGFVTESKTDPDEAHFGNWMIIATRRPLALRVTNDRGIVLDLMESDTFRAGAHESDWFNWDVVARVVEEIQEVNGEDRLWSFLHTFLAVENAFLPTNWATTRDRLHEVEAQKRRAFMEGTLPAHA